MSAQTGGAADAPSGEPGDWEDLQAFFDTRIGDQLDANLVAGAAVTLVQDGKIVFARGYGLANVVNEEPVAAGQTLFRIGSMTELFTWTAVMQLVQLGRLDLDADINTYLDFEIPAAFDRPVTLRDLMSHSAGFEDRLVGMYADTPDDLVPASQWLQENLPARVRPPGEASSYSAYGAALAGYIVERTSGMPFAAYVEANILQPLDMTQSSMRQPLPARLDRHRSAGYTSAGGVFIPHPPEVTQAAPAAAMSATATDMAHFMIAHLQNGRFGSRRFLSDDTARLMHSPLFQPDPRIMAYAYGFQTMERNGQTVLYHTGDSTYFHSQLMLLPEADTGLFVVFNSADSSLLRDDLLAAFLDHFFPGAAQPAVATAGFDAQAVDLAGDYQSNRHAYTTADKIAGPMLTAPIWKIRTECNTLLVTDPRRGEVRRFLETAPLLFQEEDGQDRLAFRADERGEIALAFLESQPAFALERLAWYEHTDFQLSVLGMTLLVFLTAPLIGLLLRKRSASQGASFQPGLAIAAIWTVTALMVVSAVFMAGMLVVVSRLVGSLGTDPGVTVLLDRLLLLPLIIGILTFVAVALVVPAWRSCGWRFVGRVYYSLLVGAALAFAWILTYWNLLKLW
ncbi:MAG: serine hydrolase domain-containing protein [Caldilineales bacterium]